MFMKRPFNGEAIWWSREQGIKEDSRKRWGMFIKRRLNGEGVWDV
jgi:hypothetical protein